LSQVYKFNFKGKSEALALFTITFQLFAT